MLPYKFRRSVSVCIPFFTALMFWGIIPGIFKVDLTTNIWSTGITVGFVFGALNAWMWWLVFKHQAP